MDLKIKTFQKRNLQAKKMKENAPEHYAKSQGNSPISTRPRSCKRKLQILRQKWH